MLSYSPEPKRLISTFLAYRNDIDIYTEDDENDKEFYRVLFNRLVDSNIRINDIIPLGCKDNVINLCKNEPDNGRRKIFIVDGDVAIIHGETISLPKLHVLESYCIENFLVEKSSICQFIYLNCGVKPIEEIEASIEYDKWLGSYSDALMELFFHFAIINKLGGKFTLYNAHKYHRKDKNSLVFDKSLVQADVENIKDEIISTYGQDLYDIEYQKLTVKWPKSVDHLLTIVSGKDYLIPLLLIKTQEFRRSKATPTLEEVKISLVQYCNLDKLTKLKAEIERN